MALTETLLDNEYEETDTIHAFQSIEKDIHFTRSKFLYALPSFSLISLTVLINVQVIIFYNEIGVSLPFLSFFQIFARSFDVLTDPLMAHISDNLTRTKCGRRIPWLYGAPFYGISFFILMSPPTTYDTDKYEYNYPATYWFGASYILFYLCDTIMNIPLFALGPELSTNPDERTSLFMWVKIFEGIGTIVGGISPVIFLSFFKMKKGASFRILATIFGIWYIISVYLIIYFVKERNQSIIQHKTPFICSIYRSFRNTAFIPLAIGWILDFCALAIMIAVLPFFIRYSLLSNNADNTLSLSVVVLFICGFISIPIWKLISNHGNSCYNIGKRNAWLLYNLLMCVTNFLFILVAPKQDLLLIIFCGLNGIPVGGQFLILSILSDVIDYDEFLNFTRNEGAFTTFSTFIPKLVAIPAQAAPLIILFMLGFKNPTQTNDNDEITFYQQNESVKLFIRITFGIAPAVIASISFSIKWRYFPIKNHEMMNLISCGIEKHKNNQCAIDPITKQNVTIQKYTKDEQHLIDILDHFGYKDIILLLKPYTIINYKSIGIYKGINVIRRKLIIWIIIGFVCILLAIFGVLATIHLLNNVHLAFVPALFCLLIGSSTVFIGFNILRFRAINQLKRYYYGDIHQNDKINININTLFRKAYYLKIKQKINNKNSFVLAVNSEIEMN